ncbi:MAG: M24 family metallopeptidase, partial [archaeon]|nr:M24 family metallopeptidase [archaeon]
MAAGSVSISAELFWQRVRNLYSGWNQGKGAGWAETRSICLLVAQPTSDTAPLKANTVSLWFTGYELTDTVFFFTTERVHILSSQKKVDMFKAIAEDPHKPEALSLELHVRPLPQASWGESVDAFRALLQAPEAQPVGMLLADRPHEASKFSLHWNAELAAGGLLQEVEVVAGWARLLAVKSVAEVADLKLAASIANGIMSKLLLPTIEKTFTNGDSKTHADMARTVEEILATPAKISRKLDPDLVESTNTTFIQSGAGLSFLQTPGSDNTQLSYDIIFASLGAKYSTQSCAISRTVLIDAPEQARPIYQTVLAAQQAAEAALLPGQSASSVRKAVLERLAQSPHPHLAEYLISDCGSAIGITVNDPSFLLDDTNQLPLEPSMTFHLRIGFSALAPDLKHPVSGNPLAVLISDTVIVPATASEKPLKLTTVPTDWQSISWETEEAKEEPKAKAKAKRAKQLHDESDEEIARQYQPGNDSDDQNLSGPALRRRQRDTTAAQRAEFDERYRLQQEDLAKNKLKELRLKYTGSG